MILNKKGVFHRCAVPELAVKSKMWEDEKHKFKAAPDAETELYFEDMIAAREKGREEEEEGGMVWKPW